MLINDLTKSIDTILLPEVRKIINTVTPDFNGRYTYETDIKSWLSPVIDLKKFYVYPMNGITGAIDWWVSRERRGIKKAVGDYEWIDTTGDQVLYMTSPSSIDGNHAEIPTNIPVVLDIAYVGSAYPQRIELPNNVEKVFFSLSKSYGINNVRTGWYFTKRPDYKLHKLVYEAKYYNRYANQVSEIIIKNFNLTYAYNKLKVYQQQVCQKYDLQPSECMWIANSTKSKYINYIRAGKTARLCITNLIKKEMICKNMI